MNHRERLRRRQERLHYPSPAEMRLVTIMGGLVVTVPIVRHRETGFPRAFIIWWPKIFREERIWREVMEGPFSIDLGNDIKRGIEVDGDPWHRDVLKEQERTDYLTKHGWRLLRLKAVDIKRRPSEVRQKVRMFLSR